MFVDIFEIFHWINFLNLIENYFEGIKDVEVERSFDSPRSVCSESATILRAQVKTNN